MIARGALPEPAVGKHSGTIMVLLVIDEFVMCIFFASPNNLLVEAITALLKNHGSYEICSTLTSLDDEELSKCRSGDIIILTDATYDCSTARKIEKIRSLNNKVSIVLVSSILDYCTLTSLSNYSIQGILTKESSIDELHTALKVASSGGKFFSSAVYGAIAGRHVFGLGRPQLSPRETEVIHFIAQGLANKEIAKRLSLSEKTVSSHKSNIKHRLSLHGTSEIVRYAIEHSLLPPLQP